MGRVWEDREIENLPSYKLQNRIVQKPKHVFLFGAGASFGSDERHLFNAGQLPPLGKDLFRKLNSDNALHTWNKFPEEVKSLLELKTFEEIMDYLDTGSWRQESFLRDLDISRYFCRFSPQSSNLYWRLAHIISQRLKEDESWSGAIITLNYDRLLEESLMRNNIFTVVKGVTFYDDDLPFLDDRQLFEVCYPHGACQFFMGQNWFKGEGTIRFETSARLIQKAGVNHILKKQNIPIACDLKQIPMICRYQFNKPPSVRNYFIELQQKRAVDILQTAESVTIVGVYCSYKIDNHIWGALASTKAKIHYIEPSVESLDIFREWAKQAQKKENEHFTIKENQFKDEFEYIKAVNKL